MSQTQPDTANRVPLSRTLGATVMKAKEYARHQGHRHITLEHLLLALVEDHDASIVLASCNVDRNRVATDVSGYIGRIEDRAQPGEAVDPVPHTDLVRIIEYATAAARQSRRREINGAIVLAAIVGEGRSTAAGILRVQGLTFEEAIKALQRASAGNKPQPQVAAEQAAEPAIPPPPAPVAELPPGPSRAAPQTTEQILAGARERIEASRQQTAPPPTPAPARTPPPPAGAPPPAAAPAPEFETASAAPAPPAPPPPAGHPVSEAASPHERAITAPPLDHVPGRAAPPPSPRPASPPPVHPSPAAAAAAAAAAPPPPPGPPPGWPAEPQGHGQPRPSPPASGRPPLPPAQPGPAAAPPAPIAGSPSPPPSPAPSLRDFERSEAAAAPPQPQPVPLPEPSQRTSPPPLTPGWTPPPQQPPSPPTGQPLPPRAREDAAPPRVPRPATPTAIPPAPQPPPQPYGHHYPESPTGAPAAPRQPSAPPWQPATDARARPVDPLAQPPPPPMPPGAARQSPSVGQARPPAPAPQSAPPPPRPAPATGSIPGLADGQLVEKIPRKMRVGIPETVEIRIAKADVQNLSVGIEGRGAPMRHDLIVTRAMSVRLRAPDGGFAIDPASPETQWIENRLGLMSDDYASWRWTITPLRRGPARLQLVVAAKTVGTDGLAADTALPDQVIEIAISTNYRQSAMKWGGWAAAAVIGGVLARFGETIVAIGSSFIGR